MTIAKVKRAAELRGLYFSGVKCWRNCTVGYAYDVTHYCGGFVQAETLDGIYRYVMQFPKL